METNEANATGHDASVSTNAPATNDILVVGTTQHMARVEAQQRGIPRSQAVAIDKAPALINPGTYIITARTKGDRAAQWAIIDDHPHHLD